MIRFSRRNGKVHKMEIYNATAQEKAFGFFGTLKETHYDRHLLEEKPMKIRETKIEDAEKIAIVHVKSWKDF